MSKEKVTFDPKEFSDSVKELDIFRIRRDGGGYDVEKLVGRTYSGKVELHWDYQTTTKTLRGAKKELNRLSRGVIVG